MITEKDKKMARFCLNCPVCSYARKRQKGLVFGIVKKLEGRFCPFCRAYKKVYNRKPHEPVSEKVG